MKCFPLKSLLLFAMICSMAHPVFAARIDTIAIATKHLATPEDVIVITPEASGNKHFPTVFLLNGFSGNHSDWTEIRTDLPQLADSLGMIFVMPDGRDSWYWDSPELPELQMESFFIEDLVPYIDNNYPTLAEASKRAISGLSMGGHGAFWLALRHPEIWGNAGSTSGGIDIRPFPNRWKIKQLIGSKDEYPERWDEFTIASLVDSVQPGKVNIIFDCGTQDIFAEVNEQLHRKMLEKGIPHDYISRPGNHSRPYWANSIIYHLTFYNENFKK